MTMEKFVVIIGLLAGFVVALFPIILFFKVWGMCDDVRRIKEILEKKEIDNA